MNVVTGEIVLRDNKLYKVAGVLPSKQTANLAELFRPTAVVLGVPYPEVGERLCASDCAECRSLTKTTSMLLINSRLISEGMPVRWQSHYEQWHGHAQVHGWEVPGK